MLLKNSTPNIEIKKTTIDWRMQRGNLILSDNNEISESLLAPYKDYFVDMITKMSYRRNSIASSEGLELIDSLIKMQKLRTT